MQRTHTKHHLALRRSELEREGALWFGIKGHSMQPFLRTGDRVLVRPCAVEGLACGDLVLFTNGAELCLHRVMAWMEQGGRRWLRTKGDWCGRWDLPVAAESVIGKGVMMHRGDRLLVLDRWPGRLLGVFGVCRSIAMGWGLWLKWRLQS